jgi:prepilin-type N-terminal cleavage/methylation domain-containing protein
MNFVTALPHQKPLASKEDHGFTLVEILIGMTILTIALLAIAAMFPMAYMTVHESGKTTMTLTAARQMLEDVRSVPFDEIINLNGFDTANSATLPGDAPEREIARRWRYALAGEGNGFTYTTDEKTRWSALSTGTSANFAGRGRITVVVQSATVRLVTVTISAPPRWRGVAISTLITRI